MKKFGLYINGQFLHSPHYRKMQREDPLAGPYEAEFSLIGTDEESGQILEAAVQGAVETHKQILKGDFFPLEERITVLKQLYQKVEKAKENLAQILAGEVKKPITLARGEIDRALKTIELSIEHAKGFFDPAELHLDPAQKSKITGHRVRVPNGVVLAITPFNFPVNLAIHKIAPAIAAGCPVLFKPSDKALLCGLYIADLCHAARVPAGFLNYIPCENEVAQKLVEDERLANLSFTGSAKVGWELSKKFSKRVTLELGGNAPVFIDKSADLEAAVEKCLKGAYGYAGQSCISVQNIFAHADVYEKVKELLQKHTKEFAFGDFSEKDLLCSSIIDEEAFERIQKEKQRLLESGAILLAQSENKMGSNIENLIPPSLFEVTNTQDDFFKNEVFAPLVSLSKIETFDEWAERVNSMENRLQCGIFTQDDEIKKRAAQELDFGGVVLNEAATSRLDSQPYGGQGKAGLGREGPFYALEDYCTWKAVVEHC